MNELGITFDKIHTYRDLGLKWCGVEIGCPEPLTEYKQIPGSSTYVDLLSVIRSANEPILSRRQLIFQFDCFGKMSEWGAKYGKVLNALNGKVCEVILDTDKQSFYRGLVKVESSKPDYISCDFQISVDADPYKYEVTYSTDRWLWDSFNFQTGVIMVLGEIAIDGTRTVRTPRGESSVIPVFNVLRMEKDLSLKAGGKTYALKAGRNRFPQIRVNAEEMVLVFSGKGTVSIEYRRRSQ